MTQTSGLGDILNGSREVEWQPGVAANGAGL